MDSTRQQKIARLIQKELSELFLYQTKLTHGLMITVSEVKISSDLSIASVYLLTYGRQHCSYCQKNRLTLRSVLRYITKIHKICLLPDRE